MSGLGAVGLMREPQRVDEASALMIRFAERTGVEGEQPPRRYLWTDAFAVCNALALADATGDVRSRRMADTLVEQVHAVLGRHRSDDPRRGWLSGLAEDEARRHPTCAGLRIGKPLPERLPHEPFDERLEWDRDGQYFHYLTRWMQALEQRARWSGEPESHRWAQELFVAAHRGFVSRARSGALRMCWKMSIALDRPLVASMGQHDPIDGLVTGLALRATAESLPGASQVPDFDSSLADFASLASQQPIETTDLLGIGGLLMDAGRVAQLVLEGRLADDGLFDRIFAGAARSLDAVDLERELARPPARRLAFRELGAAIGLAALEPIERLSGARASSPSEARMPFSRPEALRAAREIGEAICAFWHDRTQRFAGTWQEHVDINDVMLATVLLPQGWLDRRPMSGSGVATTDAPGVAPGRFVPRRSIDAGRG